MICYRDMTFCASPNCTCTYRKFTPEIAKDAREWWKSKDNPTGEGAPIAFSHFCGGEPDAKTVPKSRKSNKTK